MRLFKCLSRKKSPSNEPTPSNQPSTSTQSAGPGINTGTPTQSSGRGNNVASVPRAVGQGPSTSSAAFLSLTERSIASSNQPGTSAQSPERTISNASPPQATGQGGRSTSSTAFESLIGGSIAPLSQPNTSTHSPDPSPSDASAIQATRQRASTAFRSLIERSIASWNSLSYFGKQKDADFKLHADALRALRSLDDLFESRILFWFFHRRQSFERQTKLTKWDPGHFGDYILLPVAPGFVNKKDCFFVSHFWHTKEHPDPTGNDFRLIRSDLAGLPWKYVWVDWTCLPQSPREESHDKYFKKMLLRSAILMRECAFTWRYPSFQPRLWILVEVAQYMLSGDGSNEVTPDNRPFVNDVLEMVKTGQVRHLIRKNGYTCCMERDYRLLVGWLELIVIMSRLVKNVTDRRALLDMVDVPAASTITQYDYGIKVDKSTGIVSGNKSVYRFVPLWPPDEDGLPEVVAEPSRLEPPVCVDQVILAMKHPELSKAQKDMQDSQQRLGVEHSDTIASFSRLADMFMELEQYTEAEYLYRQALTSLQKTLTPEAFHRAEVEPINKLAEAAIKLNRFSEAEELRRRALEILQNTLGPDHPETLNAINCLGATLHMQGKFKESSPLFRQYLAGMSRHERSAS